MKDYKKLLREEIYKLDLEEFKNIPLIEIEQHTQFFDWLCYYQKNEILFYCFEHEQYNQIIKENKLLNNYCISISLEKNNAILIEYLLSKKLITKEHIFEQIDSFLMVNNDLKYLPVINKEKAVLLGNKAIYHVKPYALEYALEKGFDSKDIDLESFLFCIKNHVDMKEKQKVLSIIEQKFDISALISKKMSILEENRDILRNDNQCMEEVINIIFKDIDLQYLCQNHIKIIFKTIGNESDTQSFNFKNKILLNHCNDFSQEDLQKIKKFNKHFYREIEKVKLYQDLLNNEKLNLLKSSTKIKKI